MKTLLPTRFLPEKGITSSMGARTHNPSNPIIKDHKSSPEIVIQVQSKELKFREVPQRVFIDYSKARKTTIASGIKIFLGLLRLKVT